MNKDDYWFWICNIKDVWNGRISRLLEEFGTPKELFNTDKGEIISRLSKTELKNTSVIDNIVSSINEEKVLEKKEELKRKNIRFIHVESKEYPEKLRYIADYPYGIYCIGDISKINNMSVAMVGARNCTNYGRDIAKRLAFELGANGINVISGMARGIDGESHMGCINAGGTTYAVLGCGVDICYPRENIDLYERIIENGALISDYPMGTAPAGWQFPQRNRLISGLADKILVVEAREKSGSLITVNYGLEQGKDIYAVPGRICDTLSGGCNRLIKEGAGIVLTAKDMVDDINFSIIDNSKKIRNNNYALEKDLEMLYSCVDLFPKSIHQLSMETGMDGVNILRNLIKLQMNNLIEEPTKNYYVRKI